MKGSIMTLAVQVAHDPNYKIVHEHGFVGLIDTMGNDMSAVQAARVSYGDGTKNVRDDRHLLRYLLRHHHMTPFEMMEVKFHLKLPIFVMRQLVRHRTASMNEWSGRYSVMTDEFYTPDLDYIQPQSKTNKQGRDGALTFEQKEAVIRQMKNITKESYSVYSGLLNQDGDSADFPADYPGLTRELARTVLPVSNYTECYWKVDLRNFFGFAKLRLDPHAQREIRDLTEAMYAFVKDRFPLCSEAFEDYQLNAVTFSAMEVVLLKEIMTTHGSVETWQQNLEGIDLNEYLEQRRLTKRELQEFKTKIGL
jgi:thymidylate synthase (FAD)